MPDSVVAVSGSLSLRDGESPKIIVSDVSPLIINSSFVKDTEQPVRGDSYDISHPSLTKLFLRIPSTEDKTYKRVIALLSIFPGNVPVIFYDESTGQYDKNGIVNAAPSPLVVSELKKILGEENVVAK